MNGSQVAVALARIADQRPEFDVALKECLSKCAKTSLLKSPTLDHLKALYNVGGDAFGGWLLGLASASELDKLLSKLDPHSGVGKNSSPAQKSAHALQLISGRTAPTTKPVRATRPPKQPPMAAESILSMTDKVQRRAELEKLSAAQLKSAIKKHEVYGSTLSSKPSKAELIEHIQAAIDAGWPRSSTVLDGSRY